MLLSIAHGDGIFEHECKNQLTGDKSKGNVCIHADNRFLDYMLRKIVSKWNQSFANRMKHSPYSTHTNSFLGNSALSTRYMKPFLMKDWDWMIRMWCLNKTSINYHPQSWRLMTTYTQTQDNVEMLCLPVYSDVSFSQLQRRKISWL